ncbi:UV radiation resistance-associated protein-like [Oppia nitens]|uniref:UV radiation resistance-associated protein-like n=1 Tax=Oppia nitens TaxID=1686743 RepID=UPI0023DA7A9E|nr:UV radiation resistance-associated protein-like [Oppia nitens]
MMASIDFSMDSRVKKCFVPLVTQQRRLRHVKRMAARNIKLDSTCLHHLRQQTCDQQPPAIGLSFTVHNVDDELIYESETVFSSRPEWKCLESCSLRDSTATQVIVSLYFSDNSSDSSSSIDSQSSSTSMKKKTLFVEWTIQLNALVFIGQEIPKDNRFKDNTIILGSMEGFYTSADQIASDELAKSVRLSYVCRDSLPVMTDAANTLRNSYSLNVLYRLEMMQRVITQTVVLVNTSRTKLELLLTQLLDSSKLKSRAELMEVRIDRLREDLRRRRQRLQTSTDRIQKTESEICEKGIDMLTRIESLKQQKDNLFAKRDKLRQTVDKLLATRNQLQIRRKQIVTDVTTVYSLIPFPDGKGGLSISGVYLPDSEHLDGHDDTMISIAIGYVTHMLILLSRLFDITLRYHMIYYGSNSSIVDHLNDRINESDRVFPLHCKTSKDRLHFKYGVFLMNKNIAQLRHVFGLQTRDLSATLLNLYTLLNEKLIIGNLSDKTMTSTTTTTTTTGAINSSSSTGDSSNSHRQSQIKPIDNPRTRMLMPDPGAAGPSSYDDNHHQHNHQQPHHHVSRSLDKGLNELKLSKLMFRVGIRPNDSHESLPSDYHSNHRPIYSSFNTPGHHLHHHHHNNDYGDNDCDFSRLPPDDRLRKLNNTVDNNHLKWLPSSSSLSLANGDHNNHINNINIINDLSIKSTSSTDSSPKTHIWNDCSNNSSNDCNNTDDCCNSDYNHLKL